MLTRTETRSARVSKPARKAAILTRVSLWAGVLFLTSCSGPPPDAQGKPSGADGLVGAWRASLQFSDGSMAAIKDLEFLYVFNAGGTMTESSNYDGVPPVPPAYGIWRSTAPNQFEATYTFYSSKAPARLEDLAQGGGWLPAGRGVLTEHLTLANDGRSFESSIVLDLFDQAGRPVTGGGRATGHGVRIQF